MCYLKDINIKEKQHRSEVFKVNLNLNSNHIASRPALISTVGRKPHPKIKHLFEVYLYSNRTRCRANFMFISARNPPWTYVYVAYSHHKNPAEPFSVTCGTGVAGLLGIFLCCSLGYADARLRGYPPTPPLSSLPPPVPPPPLSILRHGRLPLSSSLPPFSSIFFFPTSF